MNKKLILIADDDRDLVNILSARCRHIGLSVSVAYDARAAFTAISQQRPDLVCLDVNMPSGSGLALCEMLANDEDMSAIPVIMLTGSSEEETIRRCHSMCAYYVQKSHDVWHRVEPILRELLGIKPDGESKEQYPDMAIYGQGLSHLIDVVTSSKSSVGVER